MGSKKKNVGGRPVKPADERLELFTFRVSDPLHEAVSHRAQDRGLSLAAHIRDILKHYGV